MPTILVVDDEDAIRNLVCAVLKSAGYHVMTARNGLEGVAVFRSYPDLIDLVITDMMMPVMNGADAIARIRESRPAVPVICTSGYADQEIPAGAMFLPKPFTPAALAELVGRVLGSPSGTVLFRNR